MEMNAHSLYSKVGLNASNKINGFTNAKLVRNEKNLPFFITPREFQCLKLLAHGKRYKEISNFLGISRRTVETYLISLKRKTNECFCGSLVDFYWNYFENKKIIV